MANPNPAALLNQPPPTATRKSVTGFVTKLVGDGATYGFINDEIFFQQTNVTDGPAGVNDRVYADCEYSEHLPIKWNATSIKILSRASSSPAATGHHPQPAPASSILDSDPRRQSRQAMLLNQQQQPPPQQQQQQQLPPPQHQHQPQFTSPNPTTVANSYQQHRQQKQQQQQQQQQQQHQHHQQQQVHPNPHEMNFNQPPLPHQQLPMGLIDQGMNQPPEFFTPFAQPPPPMSQHQTDMQPFPQHDSPMGPPKLEYTSQLGSAFVQNQFMPGPILPQQAPAPLLPQQQARQPPQQQQHQSNQRDQRGQHNKGKFNDKNERNQGNRGRNRNENKFEQSRGGERESSANRSSRSGGSRDRSGGRADGQTRGGSSKRDDANATNRQSPSSHSARSTASVSSDRGNKNSARRHYDPQNIPKSTILNDLNGSNIRSRCPSSIHVPSDLKNVIVNSYLRLDIKNTPKPVKFIIEPPQSTESEDTKDVEVGEMKKEQPSDGDKETVEPKLPTIGDNVSNEEPSQVTISKKDVEKSDQQNTPPSSKSDAKLNHKYGVKVVLISLPELEAIYKKVFGPNLDSFTNDVRSHPRLDEAIELLCNKGPNGGHSLIGGKFDPVVDGFIEGEVNEFERHGKQPDLIATCRRVVSEQTGLDLGSCQGWTLVSTFIYNNKSDYFSPKASIEYSFIYLPHIWSMVDNSLDDSLIEKESLKVNVSTINHDIESILESRDVSMTEDGPENVTMTGGGPENVTMTEGGPESVSITEDSPEKVDTPDQTLDESVKPMELTTNNQSVFQVTFENLSELKVVDLKAELDRRGIAYKPNAKKAELASLLQESLSSDIEKSTEVSGEQINPNQSSEEVEVAIQQDLLEKDDVLGDDNAPDDKAESTIENDVQTKPVVSESIGQSESVKRKADDIDGEPSEVNGIKKILMEEEPKKSEKVDLIKEPFMVRARRGQQQLTIVSLYEAIQVSRYDQFELSVASNILKESLVQHLSEYIFTCLVEENRQKLSQSCDISSSSSTGTNSQDTNNSDTNNNHTSANKTDSSKKNHQQSPDKVNSLKEYPIDRYVNLAFAYFDSTHMGYIHADDLSKLFNNTGLSISKRALLSLVGDGEKFNYRTLSDLSPKFPPSYVYKFPTQFSRLPGTSSSDNDNGQSVVTGKMIEYQGVRYDVDKLIQQVKELETTRVNMVERFNHAIENHDKQADEIHVLEVSRMSLSKSIKSLNDELSELKRERESAETKFKSLKNKLESMLSELQ